MTDRLPLWLALLAVNCGVMAGLVALLVWLVAGGL